MFCKFSKKLLITLLTICCGFLIAIDPSYSAEISLVTHDECDARMSGEIVKGDLERFSNVLNGILSHDGEAAISTRVCLNSPGGNLNEAAKIGQHFYDVGIGTFVDRGDKCLSACAFIFMMGVALGGESTFLDRAMHKEAVIGFHRPAIRIPTKNNYSNSELQNVFDVGIDSIIGLIKLSQKVTPSGKTTMMKPDLLEEALARHGEDYFYIDTVDKVGRWDIEVNDMPEIKKLDKYAAWNVCHNLIAWKSSLNKTHTNFNQIEDGNSDLNIGRYRLKNYVDKHGRQSFEVGALKMNHIRTIGDWFEAKCFVSIDEDGLNICGFSNQNDAQFSTEYCHSREIAQTSSMVVKKKFAFLSPDTKLRDIKPFQNTKLSEIEERKSSKGQCSVYRGNVHLESQYCRKIYGIDIAERIERFYFVWPSGSKTIVSRSANGSTKINGSPAKLSNRFTTTKCYKSQKTGNTFCFTPS